MKYRLTIIATFLTCLVLISARRSFDIPVWMGRWTEKQNETSATEWIFQGRDNFAKIGYGGADEIGGKVQKGTYVIDTVNKVVRLNFTKEIDIKNETVVAINYTEEWNIITMVNEEFVLSKKSSNTKAKAGSNKTQVYVQLKRTMKSTIHQPEEINVIVGKIE